MSDGPRQPQDKFIVRLPDGMRDRIAAAASANKRSMNAEVVAILEEHFREQDRFEEWKAKRAERKNATNLPQQEDEKTSDSKFHLNRAMEALEAALDLMKTLEKE